MKVLSIIGKVTWAVVCFAFSGGLGFIAWWTWVTLVIPCYVLVEQTGHFFAGTSLLCAVLVSGGVGIVGLMVLFGAVGLLKDDLFKRSN